MTLGSQNFIGIKFLKSLTRFLRASRAASSLLVLAPRFSVATFLSSELNMSRRLPAALSLLRVLQRAVKIKIIKNRGKAQTSLFSYKIHYA